MLYVGRMSHAVILFHESSMETKTNSLHTHNLEDLRALRRTDKRHAPVLNFNYPHNHTRFELEAISDASMSPATEGGGRGGYIIFRRCGDTIHPVQWSARKLRRVARSSSTAELLSASDAASSIVYLQELMNEI